MLYFAQQTAYSAVICLAWVLSAGVAGAQEGPVSEPEAPRLVVAEEVIDLGKLKQGQQADAVFILRNEGQADLQIKDIQHTCGCTVAELADRERRIPPGGEVLLPVVFDSKDRAGPQNPKVRLATNDPERNVVELELKAEVVSPYVIEPSRSLPFQSARRGVEIARKIRLFPSDAAAELEVVELVIDHPFVEGRVSPVEDKGRRGQALAFTIGSNAPLGDLETTGRARLRVGADEAETTLALHGTVVGDLSYRPVQISVLKNVQRGQSLQPVAVVSMEQKPFQVLQADGGPHVVATVTPQNDRNTEYRILLQLAENAPAGPLGTTLRISTDTLEHPLIEVPVFVSVPDAVSVDPLVVRLTSGPSPIERERRIRLRNTILEPLEVTGATCDLPFVRAEILPKHENPRFNVSRVVVARLEGDVPSELQQGTLIISTDRPGAENIRLPVEVGPARVQHLGPESPPASATNGETEP